jgi:pilus assembly protein Flp/PilA
MLFVKLSAYITNALYQLREEEEGQTLVEYALIIALVSVGLVAALTALNGSIAGVFTTIGDALAAV